METTEEWQETEEFHMGEVYDALEHLKSGKARYRIVLKGSTLEKHLMVSKKKNQHPHRKNKKGRHKPVKAQESLSDVEVSPKRLEIVLKCDTSGCVEAIANAISALALPEVEVLRLQSCEFHQRGE